MWANHSRGEPVLDCVSDAKGPWHKDVVICWGPIWMLGYCVSLMGSHARPGDLTPLALLKWEMSSLWGRAVSEKSFSGWPEVVLRSLGACPIFFFFTYLLIDIWLWTKLFVRGLLDLFSFCLPYIFKGELFSFCIILRMCLHPAVSFSYLYIFGPYNLVVGML